MKYTDEEVRALVEAVRNFLYVGVMKDKQGRWDCGQGHCDTSECAINMGEAGIERIEKSLEPFKDNHALK